MSKRGFTQIELEMLAETVERRVRQLSDTLAYLDSEFDAERYETESRRLQEYLRLMRQIQQMREE